MTHTRANPAIHASTSGSTGLRPTMVTACPPLDAGQMTDMKEQQILGTQN